MDIYWVLRTAFDESLSVFLCHMHVIPPYKGDVPNLKGGVRGVIPSKQNFSNNKRQEKPSTSAKNDIKRDEI